MAYTGKQSDIITDEQMGVFSGYIRRPKPTQTGMVAQIFGENGDDADTILALSLSKYQDTQVFVNIYLVKDPNGRIMKQGETYPLISSFVGFVRRSMPQKDGMIAQFFSPNGEHADEVALLSKSDYQDCLVFVDVRGAMAARSREQIAIENQKQIEENYTERITKHQKTELVRRERQFKKMNEHLHFSEFLYRVEVLKSLGDSENFQTWLKNQLCSHHQEGTCLQEAHAVEVDFIFKPFNYLPVCDEHEAALADEQHIKEHKAYYEMKHKLLTKEWAWHRMKEKFSYDGRSEPDPSKIVDWANTKNLSRFLPSKFQPVL